MIHEFQILERCVRRILVRAGRFLSRNPQVGTVNLTCAERDLGRIDGRFLNHSGTRHLRPNEEGALSQYPVVGWPQQMPSDPEEIQDDSVDRQESLRLSSGLEPSHLSLSLSSWLVRGFSPIVGVAGGVVND